jgi:hypothetical protein
LMSSMVAKRAPLRPIFRVGNSQKSFGVRNREDSGLVKKGMSFSVRNCSTASYASRWVVVKHATSSELHRTTSKKLACRNDQ